MAQVTGFILPLLPRPQRLSVVLNNTTYRLRTRWLSTVGCWTLDISDRDNNLLIGSIALVRGADLLEQFGYVGIGGKLFAYNTQGPPDDPPGFTTLGNISQVVFVPDSAFA